MGKITDWLIRYKYRSSLFKSKWFYASTVKMPWEKKDAEFGERLVPREMTVTEVSVAGINDEVLKPGVLLVNGKPRRLPASLKVNDTIQITADGRKLRAYKMELHDDTKTKLNERS